MIAESLYLGDEYEGLGLYWGDYPLEEPLYLGDDYEGDGLYWGDYPLEGLSILQSPVVLSAGTPLSTISTSLVVSPLEEPLYLGDDYEGEGLYWGDYPLGGLSILQSLVGLDAKSSPPIVSTSLVVKALEEPLYLGDDYEGDGLYWGDYPLGEISILQSLVSLSAGGLIPTLSIGQGVNPLPVITRVVANAIDPNINIGNSLVVTSGVLGSLANALEPNISMGGGLHLSPPLVSVVSLPNNPQVDLTSVVIIQDLWKITINTYGPLVSLVAPTSGPLLLTQEKVMVSTISRVSQIRMGLRPQLPVFTLKYLDPTYTIQYQP